MRVWHILRGKRSDDPGRQLRVAHDSSQVPSVNAPSYPPSTQSPNDYIARCTRPEFQGRPEPRTFSSSPKFQTVLEPQRRADYAGAIRAGLALLPEFADFDLLYCWLTSSYCRLRSFDEGIAIATKGLAQARRKNLLLHELGTLFSDAGNLEYAVYYWAQSILSCPDRASDAVWPYLYLSYIAEVRLHDTPAAASFRAHVDAIDFREPRLRSEAANRLYRLAWDGSPAVTEVIDRLITTLNKGERTS